MSLRKGHGTGAGVPRIEVIGDELPMPPQLPPAAPKVAWADMTPEQRRAQAVEWGKQGPIVKAERTALLRSLGIIELAADHAFRPYEVAGAEFAEKHIETLSTMFGCDCAEGPASIVWTSGMQLAASRFVFDAGKQTGNAKMLGEASRLADASRQSLLAAYELQSREAAARQQSAQNAKGQHGRSDLYEEPTK